MMKCRVSQFSIAALSALLLASCSFHEVDLSPNFWGGIKTPPTYSITADDTAQSMDAPWWVEFSNAHLDNLIAQAYANNLDVVQAVSRVKQARALTTQTQSDIFPKIDGIGSVGRQWQGSDSQPSTRSVGGELSWELDLFGRIQNDTTARNYEAQARAEDVNATLLTLSSDIATAYYGAVISHKQKQLIERQISTDRDLLSLVNLRVNNGIGTKLDQLQQQSNVAASESQLPLVEGNIRVFENRLDVLLGHAPDGQDKTDNKISIQIPKAVPNTGIPLDLLENRPDLRALKNELIAADADIAQAISDRLPQMTLTGSYLYSDTTSYSGPVGVLLGSFVQPLLDWGERKAEVERNKAIYEERLAAYTKLFLQAVEEVENTLYLENKQRDYIRGLEKRERILRSTVNEARARYEEGLDDYTPVLNALQELRIIERDVMNEQYQLIQYRIQLHRALGGRIIL